MKGELRERLGSLLDGVSDETIKSLIEESLAADKTISVEIFCKHCRRSGKYPVDIPDIQARVKALDVLVNQAKGKPKETTQVDVNVQARSVEGMTLAELELEEARLVRELEAPS